MSDKAKAANLTEDEIDALMNVHCQCIIRGEIKEDHIDRINYLNKRLKSFKEPEEIKPVEPPA